MPRDVLHSRQELYVATWRMVDDHLPLKALRPPSPLRRPAESPARNGPIIRSVRSPRRSPSPQKLSSVTFSKVREIKRSSRLHAMQATLQLGDELQRSLASGSCQRPDGRVTPGLVQQQLAELVAAQGCYT